MCLLQLHSPGESKISCHALQSSVLVLVRAVLVLVRAVFTSGARSAERVYFYIPEKSQYERPAGRPAVVTLFERLFLWNGMTNSRTVILIRCHHPINHVFDRYRYPPVPATACGTCRGEGVEDTLSLGNSTTAGPIAFKFGV